MYTFFHHLVIEKKGIRETVLIKLKNMNKKIVFAQLWNYFFPPVQEKMNKLKKMINFIEIDP